MRCSWGLAAGVVVSVSLGAAQLQPLAQTRNPAMAPPSVPAFWLGAWSPDPACGPDAVAHVFGPGSFELREGPKRVYRGEAKLDVKGDLLTVQLTRDIENLVEDDDGPKAGDTIAYRKRGQKIRPDTFTRDGLTHANPDFGPDFNRCGN